jgi:23S rRNA (uridine2552-2'-O)-methyltransferase
MYRRKDAYYVRAKAEGYRSRAAYKLHELQQRYHILRRGDYVVDLGCAPGAWLQVAVDLVGPEGRVVGVDIVPVTPTSSAILHCVRGDVRDAETAERVLDALERPPTVVLSDMAPRLTGVRPRDEARCAELVGAAFDFATAILAPGGRLVVKVLVGTDAADLATIARRRFQSCKLTRPDATRKGSTECYLVASGFKA